MDNSISALALVVVGAIFLSGGMLATHRIVHQTPRKISWGFLRVLIVLFIVGYAAFGMQLLANPMSDVLFIVSLIFFGGGAFVLVISRLSLATIADVKKVTVLETEKSAMAAENTLIRSMQSRLELILDNVGEGIFVLSEDGIIEVFNPAAERLFGYSEAEILGKHIGQLIPCLGDLDASKELARTTNKSHLRELVGRKSELVGKRQTGIDFPIALKIESLILDGRTLYTGLMEDISERKAMLDRLKIMAEHDGLTGLYNRTSFVEQLRQLVQRIKRNGQVAGLLHIDLDHFKYVNDMLGHAAGDRVLIDVGQLLIKRLRKTDIIARLGGDEFIVALFDASPEYAYSIAESIRTTLSAYRYAQDGKFVDVGCSIGVFSIDEACESEAQALCNADLACHTAKRAGRNRIHVFRDQDLNDITTVALDMGWSRRIKESLRADKFVLARQPIVEIEHERVAMYEVLIRLYDEHGTLVLPGGFLPAAERFGLSADIDKWVIRNAINSLVEQRNTVPAMRYSINLSGHSLTDESVYRLITDCLETTALDPAALIFEITESVAICDMVAAETFLSKLRRLGCKTALDDFGSGFSSFSYLKNLPVDYVKIDGSFIKNLAANPVDQAMIKSINDIAHVLGKETVAEFVESEAILQFLRIQRVDYAQGYHFGRAELIDIPGRKPGIPYSSRKV